MFGQMTRGHEPRWRMGEVSGVFDGGVTGAASGILAGARVATSLGWRAADAIEAGDMVLTFDGGLQPVTAVSRRPVWAGEDPAPRAFWPLHVAAGALGNRQALRLLPRQFVMIESDAGEELFGDPFSLIRSNTLDGMTGVEAVAPSREQMAVVFHFDDEQVIFDQSGVLYYCPPDNSLTKIVHPTYRALSDKQADLLLALIETDKAEASLWGAEDEMPAHIAAA